MKFIKLTKGLALLEVILSSILLVGLIYLVMHTTSTYRQHEKAKSIGERLAPVISEALRVDYTSYSDHGDQILLVEDPSFCKKSPGILKNLSPNILEGFKRSGFSLCNSTLSLGDPCDSKNCDAFCSGGSGVAGNCSGTCTSSTTPSCTYTCVSRIDQWTGIPTCYAKLDP